MLVPFADLLSERRRDGGAIGAFTCYDLETTRAVLDAANAAAVGVILLISKNSFADPGGDQLLVAVRAAAERAPARACVQLDHVSDLDLIAAAFDAGCGAVMVDGSHLQIEDNIGLSAEAARIAHRVGGSIEVELGHIRGDEDVATGEVAKWLTNPRSVSSFVAKTTADCLAVSIGNVHGEYVTAPSLDWPRLAAIRGVTDVALSLHGASGIPDDDIARAIGSGISKINVNTDLRKAYLAATSTELVGVIDGYRLLTLHKQQAEAVREVASEKLRQFSAGMKDG